MLHAAAGCGLSGLVTSVNLMDADQQGFRCAAGAEREFLKKPADAMNEVEPGRSAQDLLHNAQTAFWRSDL
jgi:hypothetical protein